MAQPGPLYQGQGAPGSGLKELRGEVDTTPMILDSGTKVLIAHRRLFQGDHGRYFAGVVEDFENGLARVAGHTWIRDGYDGTFHQKEDLRTKVVPVLSGSVIVYQLPGATDLSSFRIEHCETRTVVRDDFEFKMDLSEGVLYGGSELRPGQSVA